MRSRADELIRTGRGLYLILTSPRLPHVDLARAAVERGVPAVQLREKSMPDDELLALAVSVRDVTRGTDTLFIVNDRPDIAASSGADGVHLGKDDTDVETARELMGPGTIVGVSTRLPDEAEAAERVGADYIGIGPVFRTGTKPDALAPVGLSGLAAVTERVPGLPGVAVGGIAAEKAAGVLAAGARYVAVISAICFADDPVAALDGFMKSMSGGSC
jgi:thiamine-phosphate pyrophosphorylase